MKITDISHYIIHPGVGKNLYFVKIDTDEGVEGLGRTLYPG